MVRGNALIVDDNPDAQQILKMALTHLGLEVEVASDGVEALDSIYASAPDIILLDIMMPRMNGFQVLHRMQANPMTRHIPVIVISAAASDMMLDMPGVSKVIRKAEYSMADLQAVVKNLLAGAQAAVAL